MYRTPEQINREKRSEAARVFNALRPRSVKNCPVCHRDFQARKDQRFCSTNCRVKAWQKRRLTLPERKALTVRSRKAGVAGANAVED